MFEVAQADVFQQRGDSALAGRRLVKLQGDAQHQRVALQQILHLEFIYPAQLQDHPGLLDFRNVEDQRAGSPGTAFEAMQNVGNRTGVVGYLCQIGADHSEADPLRKVLKHHTIPMEHRAAGVSGRVVLGIDIKTDEVIELQAAFLP